MRSAGLISGVALSVLAVTLSARDFPLTLKTLTLEESMALPGGSGMITSLQLVKPLSVKKEVRAVSKRPLYGELRRSTPGQGFAFRVDESAGDGKGYDQLLLDLNQNGDLTDDPAIKLADQQRPAPDGVAVNQMARFGPIEVQGGKPVGGSRLVYFADMNCYLPRTTGAAADLSSGYIGYLRLKPGSYLETVVELDGIRQKVGVLDGNANMRFGEEPKATIYRSGNEEQWYFPPADVYLRDTDGSGKFENRPGDPESSPFGPMLYFGATPYRVTLTNDGASLRVEPWSEALATLTVQPTGSQVRDVLVAWEQKPNDWKVIKPGVAEGRVRVPPGRVRLTGCVLEGETKDGQSLVLVGYYRKLDPAVDARAGQAATLRCGSPLEVKLTTQPEAASSMVASMPAGNNATPGTKMLRIQAEILGAGGETYATFVRVKPQAGEPPRPRFNIRTQDGKEVGSGNLEFG